MKRFIPSAFATLALPFLAMAQSSTPPSDEEKLLVPKAPVAAPETVVPAVPGVSEKPAERELDRPGPPGAKRPGPPGAKRRGSPDAKDKAGAPEDRIPTPAGAAPGSNPSTDPERSAPVPGKDRPSARPGETPGTPPAPRGKGRATPDTPPATPGTADTPSATPGTTSMPPATPGTPTASTDTPPATPGTPGTRPLPGRKSTDRPQRGVDPSVTPAPASGAPMPAATATPEVPGQPKSAQRPERGERPGRPGAPKAPAQETAKEAAPAPGAPMPAVTTTPEVPSAPKSAQPPEGRDRPERPAAEKPPSQETAKVLADEPKRDRQADAVQARKIDNPADAKRLLLNILGGAVGVGVEPNDRPNERRRRDGRRPDYRPSVEEVGRTQQDRERTVTSIVERFQGRAPQPQAVPSGRGYREQRIFDTVETQRRTQFYEGNRRVIRYSSMQEIPPVIVASQQLNRVQVLPQAKSTYTVRPPAPQQGRYQNDIPASYTTGDAYAVSYSVDPESAISTDAILFRQGSTDFADAYSYDLVIDMANAMKDPALGNNTFVIEGHASAEGDYAQNLQLSQERAERISRELVNHGVSAERLMPVGYGEAEAAAAADANEADRRLDRRVVVFRMK